MAEDIKKDQEMFIPDDDAVTSYEKFREDFKNLFEKLSK